MKKIKIEVIHDIVCSWCPIGYKNVKNALDILSNEIEADIFYLPFELNPTLEPQGISIDKYLMRNNHWNQDQFDNYCNGVVESANKVGLVYDYSKRTHYYNTSKAHLLQHWSEQYNKQEDFHLAIIEAYFKLGKNISDDNILLEIISNIGLNLTEASKVLQDHKIDKSLQKKYARVDSFNIQRIPAFIINDTYLVAGTNTVQYFVEYFGNTDDYTSIQNVS